MNACALLPTKPMPPGRSGWLGAMRRFSRETDHRNRNQTKIRAYQRSWMNWKNGMLMNAYHQPEAVRCKSAPCGVAYHVAAPSAT